VTAGADTRIKGFADACRKDKEGVAKGVVLKGIVSKDIILKGVLCHKDKKGKQRREKVIASLVRIELRQL
jgi:hypothetical protein